MESAIQLFFEYLHRLPIQSAVIGLVLFLVAMVIYYNRAENKIAATILGLVIILLFVFLGFAYWKPPSGPDSHPTEEIKSSQIKKMIDECNVQIEKLKNHKNQDAIEKIKIRNTIRQLHSLVEDLSSSNEQSIQEGINDFPIIVNKANGLLQN